MKEYYKILGVQPKCDPKTLRKAWREKCKEHHPDHGGDPEEFVRVTHAYRMLSDPAYVAANSSRPTKSLDFTIRMVATFDEAFYGTHMVFSFNRIIFDENYEPIKSDLDVVSLSWELPPGSNNGFSKRIQGSGMRRGGETGDAAIDVVSERHPRYKVSDGDVHVEEQIPLEVMLKGGEVPVATLWGIKMAWVNPGTLPGQEIRIPGCGVNQEGFQVCRVEPVFPDEGELRQDAWKGLDINWQQAEARKKEDDELLKKFEELVKGSKDEKKAQAR